MEAALRALSQSGSLGAVIAAVLALFGVVIAALIWMLKRMVDSSLAQTKRMVDSSLSQADKFGAFMEELTKSLGAISSNCQVCQSSSLAAIRDVGVGIRDKIDHVTWAAHDKAALERDKAIGSAVESVEESITGAAQSIRTGINELAQGFETRLLKERLDEARALTPTPVRAGR